MTLCFVGEVHQQDVEVIGNGIRSALTGETPSCWRWVTAAAFPGPITPGWSGWALTGNFAGCRTFKNLVAEEIRSLGFRLDRRPFSPHVTLARVSRNASEDERRSIARSAGDLTCYRLGSFEVRSVELMESVLSREGATYSTVAQISLVNLG